jgi:hypothetical protein
VRFEDFGKCDLPPPTAFLDIATDWFAACDWPAEILLLGLAGECA